MSSFLDKNRPAEVTMACSINIGIPEAYQLLLDPNEQLKWNSEWSEAKLSPSGEIKNGYVLTVFFKGGERSQYILTNVIPNSQFTYYSRIKILGWFHLGDVHQSFRLMEKNGKTELLQKVLFEPKGMGSYLKSMIINRYSKRFPKIFEDFIAYIDRQKEPVATQ